MNKGPHSSFRFILFIGIIVVASLFIFIGCDSCDKNSGSIEPETVTDIDGNEYQTIKIGNQVWMAENLKVTRYRNGDAILSAENPIAWGNLAAGGYCTYGNDANNADEYGHLYNWYAVSGSRSIAPEGWHVPTDS